MTTTETNQPRPSNEPQAQKGPVHEIKQGMLKAAIWKNEGSEGPFYSVTLGRLFKNDEGKWRTSQRFGAKDLTNVPALIEEIQTWITQNPADTAQQ